MFTKMAILVCCVTLALRCVCCLELLAEQYISDCPPELQRIVNALPVETSTLIVARSFLLPVDDRFDESETEPYVSGPSICRTLALGPLFRFAGMPLIQDKSRPRVNWAVLACSDIQNVGVLGSPLYKGCHVVNMDSFDRPSLIEWLQTNHVRKHLIMDRVVYELAWEFERDAGFPVQEWESLFVVHPDNSWVVSATSEEFLRAFLNRYALKSSHGVGTASRLYSWRLLSDRARAWVIDWTAADGKTGNPFAEEKLIQVLPAELRLYYVTARELSANDVNNHMKKQFGETVERFAVNACEHHVFEMTIPFNEEERPSPSSAIQIDFLIKALLFASNTPCGLESHD